MKRSPLKKVEDKLWAECRRITFETAAAKHPNGWINCYTCSQQDIQGMNCQCGHLHPKGACGATMKYDLRILRPQCFQCNINHGGMGAVFLTNMEKEIGRKKTDALMLEAQGSKGKPVKAFDYYTKLLEKYKKIRL